MTLTPTPPPAVQPETATLLFRRVAGDAARSALALAGGPSPCDGGSQDHAVRGAGVYELVDVGAPEVPLGAAVVTVGADDVERLRMFVSPPYRRRGLGSRILLEVLDVLRSQGSPRVDVDVGDDPVVARLCGRRGFRPVEGVPGRMALEL